MEVIRLSQFVCLPQYRLLSGQLARHISLEGAVFRDDTARQVDQNGILRSDVEIIVFGWNRNGYPAPNLSFHWRCRTSVGRC